MVKPFIDRHRRMIESAAGLLIAVADDSGLSLVEAIAAMERYIIQETKVGDAGAGRLVPPDRRGYMLVEGRFVEVSPAGQPPKVVGCGCR